MASYFAHMTILSFGLPLILSVPPLLWDKYGYDYQTNQCWLKTNPDIDTANAER